MSDIIKIKAIDIIPYKHALRCIINDAGPFDNTIIIKRWSSDGSKINFMLDSHNFFSAKPDDLVDFILEIDDEYNLGKEAQSEFLTTERPNPKIKCSCCNGTGLEKEIA